jgi:hypothetical protein
MAGYSSTPLWKKLGYKPGLAAYLDSPPEDYIKLLDLPAGITIDWLGKLERGASFVHLFTTKAATLQKKLAKLRKLLAADGVIWVSWPKKASHVATDITEDVIRAIALPTGLVDIKVCAVDETWSGLKLMIRKTER